MSVPVFDVSGLGYRYPDGRWALRDVSLRIEPGERVALLGANGSGKTTLLLNLLGLLRPEAGVIRAFGEPVTARPADLKRLRSRVGLVFQNPDSQLLSASVAEDVSFGPLNLGLDRDTVRDRVAESLAAVGMSAHADTPVHALSFGQKKLVCIAGVLAMRPRALLLDEPTAGLDARAVDHFLGIITRLNGGDMTESMTIVAATHDIEFAYAWADRAEVLHAGTVVASCRSERFAEEFPRLTAYGLARPRVAEVYRAAVDAGLLGEQRTPPRSHEELLDAIRDAGSRTAAAAPAPAPAAPDPLEEAV